MGPGKTIFLTKLDFLFNYRGPGHATSRKNIYKEPSGVLLLIMFSTLVKIHLEMAYTSAFVIQSFVGPVSRYWGERSSLVSH